MAVCRYGDFLPTETGNCGRLRGARAAFRRPQALAVALSFAASLLATSVASAQESDAYYVGDAACLSCHEALHEGFTTRYQQTIHSKVLNEGNALTAKMMRGCEACHGAGSEHVAAGGGKGVGGFVDFESHEPEAVAAASAVCMQCHDRGDRLYWHGSTHASRDVGCTSCHVVMRNVSRRDQLAKKDVVSTCGSCHKLQLSRQFRNSHMPVRGGKMDCASCHNPHGTIADSLISATTINDNCYECHADKRGPFLWEHPPVTENCLNCHDPHGTTRDHMLKLSPPRLCQSCHTDAGHARSARAPDHRFVRGASCLQCHTLVHGSNHPSGNTFTR